MSPSSDPPLRFGDFILDPAAARLTRGGTELPLRPKAYALLLALARHRGQLVTKDELLDTVWGRRFITEGVIKSVVAELRAALGDDSKAPRWIQTVARRGYRFAAESSEAPGVAPMPVSAPTGLVGRDAEMKQLAIAWAQACAGTRRLLLVSGEPGAGKSALLTAFVDGLEGGRVACGPCVQGYGGSEPYLPWLEALRALADDDAELLPLLRQVAPSWLAQLPWLHTEADRAAFAASGPPPSERMPREMVTLLERLADREPLLLWLEDLHWSDHASVQLLDFIARRRGPSRLLLAGSYRATELVVAEHPLDEARREWRLHGLCDEICLDGWSAPQVREFAQQRLPGAAIGSELAALLRSHTEGLPLFVRAVLEALVAERVFERLPDGRWQMSSQLPSRLPLPDSLTGVFQRRLDGLSRSDQELLEAAATAGLEFDPAVLAQALSLPRATLEARCEGLVRRGRWLRAAGSLPDAAGQPAARYRFEHALMQQACYSRLGPARRMHLHRALATALVVAHPDAPGTHAAELAHHFEQAAEPAAAMPCFEQACERAISRQAWHEAIALAARALELLALPAGSDLRARWAGGFALVRGIGIGAVRGYAAPDFAQALEQALALLDGTSPDHNKLVRALRGLWLHHLACGRNEAALALAERAVASTRGAAAGPQLNGLSLLVFSAFKVGDFERARHALDTAAAIDAGVPSDDTVAQRQLASLVGDRSLVAALIDVLQGRQVDPAPLRACIHGAWIPLSRVQNGLLLALLLAWQGDAAAVLAETKEALRLIEDEGMGFGRAAHRLMGHWAEGVLGGSTAADVALAGMQAAMEEHLADGQLAQVPAMYELLADLALRQGRLATARHALDEAFAMMQRTGERYVQARLEARRAALDRARGEASP